MKVYYCIFLFVFGAVIGSFINCFAYRYVNKQSIITNTRSKCVICGHALGVFDLIPIASFLLLRGRCRYCKGKIHIRYFLSEVILAIAFLLLGILLNDILKIIVGIVFFSILLFCSLVDIDIKIVPNISVLLLTICFIPFLVASENIIGTLAGALIGGVVIPGVITLISLIISKITKKPSIGGGDIKLLFAIGLILGPINSLLNIALMSLLGLVFVFINKIRKDEAFAFVPFISVSTFFIYIFATYINSYYQLLVS